MSLKILHIVYSLEPGGMENGIVNMVSRLSNEDLQFEICCLGEAGRMASRLPDGCSLHVLGKSAGFDRQLPDKLRRLIGEVRPDLLHTHNLGPLIYTALAKILGAQGQIFHGEHASLTQNDLSLRKRLQRKLLYRFCTALHTVGVSMSQQLEALKLTSCPVLTLQNGVDTQRFTPSPDQAARRGELGLPQNARMAGIFGRFGPYKRHDLLLDSFARIGDEFPGLHLLVAGGGGEREPDVLARIRSHPLASRIHTVGYLSDPVSHYQSLDLLLIPSDNEGLSNCALEAMSCAVPVLSNRNCGSDELITDGQDGIVRAMDTPEALADALVEVMGSDGPGLRALGAHAREKIIGGFSLNSMEDAYRNAYQSIASRRG